MKRLVAVVCLLACALPAPSQTVGRNGIKKGEWRLKDVPEGWHVLRAGYYTFQSNAPKERVKKVARHLNAAYRLYQKTFPSGRTPKRPFVVKIFKDRQGFMEYGAPPGAGAYYSWHDKEMVGYDTGKLDGKVDLPGTTGESSLEDRLRRARAKRKLDMLGVFAHEGWHQYFHFICTSKISFPSWCDEGIGEYFYTMRHRNGRYELGAPNDYRLKTIQKAIEKDRFIPLEKLVTYDQRKYYRVAGLAYAEGWSFVHFLLEHPDYMRRRYLQRFLKVFIDQHSIEEAVERVFRRMPWERVTEDWKAWVMAMEVEDPVADAVRKGLEGQSGGEKPAGSGGKEDDGRR